MSNKGEIVIYQPNQSIQMEVLMEEETVWLTQAQMVQLFDRDRTVITKHINNVFNEKELDKKSNVHFLHIANSDKPVKIYNLDVIISVGYRVKSKRGTQFRQWASGVKATVYTSNFTPQLKLDLDKHNAQYPPISIHSFNRSHDRFLFIDNTTYHIGASLKDLGKRWFAFSKMKLNTKTVLIKM
jgi:hypothetical protein